MSGVVEIHYKLKIIFPIFGIIIFWPSIYLLFNALIIMRYPEYFYPDLFVWSFLCILFVLFSFCGVAAVYTLFRPSRLVVTADGFALDAGILGHRVTRWADVDRLILVYRKPFLPEVCWVRRDHQKRHLNRLIGYDGIIPFGMYWSGRRFLGLMESYLEDYRRRHPDERDQAG